MKTASKTKHVPGNATRPTHHTRKVAAEFKRLVKHLREDIDKVSEPKAQALFETAAEVLLGLTAAFQHYGSKQEKAWRKP
jgi:hypothetical protein